MSVLCQFDYICKSSLPKSGLETASSLNWISEAAAAQGKIHREQTGSAKHVSFSYHLLRKNPFSTAWKTERDNYVRLVKKY